MTRRKKIIVTILVMVLVLPILAIATLGILATLFPSEKHTFTNELLLPMTRRSIFCVVIPSISLPSILVEC